MMRAPAFWADPESLAGRLLAPLGRLYGAVTLARMGRAGGGAGVPVICIGNPTLGGAGKTPVAIALLDHLTAAGARPFALLRGHGGSARTPLLVDLARHDAALVGDEALLLARHAPTVVASGDRLGGARLAAGLGASHIVMDDGFQNPGLAKDASVLVVDGGFGVGNGRVFPAGPLRAPLAPQLARADALMVVGAGPRGEALAAGSPIAVMTGRLVPDAAVIDGLRGVRLHAFAGIGRPEKVFAMLQAEGLDLSAATAFADHHPYRPAEIATLARAAATDGARLVTTQKDLVRLAGAAFAGLRAGITAVPVRLETDPAGLARLVALAEKRFR